MRWAVMASAVAGLAPRAGGIPETQPVPSPHQDPKHYLDWLKTNLAEGPQQQRNEAAERLIEIGSTEAHNAITAGLSANDERTQYACAKAIADHGAPDPDWRNLLVALLGRDRPPSEPAARALGRYDGDDVAYRALIRFAQGRQASARLPAIHALGQVVQKPVAEALVGIVSDAAEDPAARSAAAEALAHLSGHRDYGLDFRQWQQWLNGLRAKNPADWRAQVLADQHPQLEHDDERTREHVRQLKAKFQELAFDDFERQPPAAKPAKLLARLSDPEPSERETGAWIVSQAVAEGQPMTDDVRKRLIELVGDSSTDVRVQVAQALIKLSDPTALDAILTQLQLEKDAQVKVALIQAVARIGSARAIPILRQLLHDGSAEVAAAAANAVKALAPAIRNDATQANRLFQELQQVMAQRTGPPGQPNGEPGSEELRVALVGALAPLVRSGDQTATDLFHQLLTQNESPRTREAVLQALAEMGDAAGVGPFISNELDPNAEPDPAVRSSAALALGQIGNFIYASQLYDSTRRQTEPDPQVQKVAWTAFQGLLPHANLNDLSYWADRFGTQRELAREAVVLTVLSAKLKAADDKKNLAIEQQRLGDVYLELHQPDQAIPYLKNALDYWQSQPVQRQNIVGLVGALMNAYLANRQFHEAVQFGQQEIARVPAYQEEIGPAIRDAADTLLRKADVPSYKDAAKLIQEALQITPPLRVNDALEQLRTQIPAEYRNPQD